MGFDPALEKPLKTFTNPTFIMRMVLAFAVFAATLLVARLIEGCSHSPALEKAIVTDDLAAVMALLDKRPGLLHIRAGEFKNTPLHTAAMHGRYEIAELLLGRGADPNAADRYGYTPLHKAANFGKNEVLLLLLAQGADPGKVSRKYDKVNFTPLHVAAENGYPETVGLLLDNGAAISPWTKPGRNIPPLHIAAGRGNYDVCHVLLERGADPNALDDNLHSPMYWARETGHDDIADLIYIYGGR